MLVDRGQDRVRRCADAPAVEGGYLDGVGEGVGFVEGWVEAGGVRLLHVGSLGLGLRDGGLCVVLGGLPGLFRWHLGGCIIGLGCGGVGGGGLFVSFVSNDEGVHRADGLLAFFSFFC